MAQRLSRPQVIQPNAVSVVMATCVLQPAALQQDKRGCLDRQITGKRKAVRDTLRCLEPLISIRVKVLTEMGHGNNHASTWVIFLGYRDRFSISCIYSGAGVWLSDEGLAYMRTQQQQKADTGP